MRWLQNLLRRGKGAFGHGDATTVEIHGKALRCQICRNRYFWRHDVMLNTRLATFLDLDWMNRDAICAVCDHCGYMHWFIPPQIEREKDREENAPTNT